MTIYVKSMVAFTLLRHFRNFLLDKGHEAENLQKECLFLLHYHFPMEDSSELFYW